MNSVIHRQRRRRTDRQTRGQTDRYHTTIVLLIIVIIITIIQYLTKTGRETIMKDIIVHKTYELT